MNAEMVSNLDEKNKDHEKRKEKMKKEQDDNVKRLKKQIEDLEN